MYSREKQRQCPDGHTETESERPREAKGKQEVDTGEDAGGRRAKIEAIEETTRGSVDREGQGTKRKSVEA